MTRGMDGGEPLNSVWAAIGELRAHVENLDKAKTDKAESVGLGGLVAALERAKADRTELVALQGEIIRLIHEEISDLGERVGDRINTLNSRIIGISESLAAMSENDARRGAEVARLAEALEDLARAFARLAESQAAEKQNRWRKARQIAHAVAQYGFQAFAGLALLVMLLREGVTGLPEMIGLAKAALGIL